MKFNFFLYSIVFITLFALSYSITTGSELETLMLKNRKLSKIQIKTKDDPNKKESSEDSNKETVKRTKKIVPKKNYYVPKLYDNADIYWSGWIKYFHYDYEAEITSPKRFYDNPEYYEQKVYDSVYNEATEINGEPQKIHIPGKQYFWGVLTNSDNFNILGSRKDSENSNAILIENLNTDLIDFIVPDDNANGAIRDLGTFIEGSCMKISVTLAKPLKNEKYTSRTSGDGEKQTWIICTDTEKQKKRLLSFLIAIKLRRQERIDDVVSEKITETNYNSGEQLIGGNYNKPRMKKYTGPDASIDDGYLILLQDWSDCSLKCGGGVQLQQWMCVPPKGKGKPCADGNIIERPCNIEPCPVTKSDSLLPQKKNSVTLTPIYKAMPFSSRPQQYVKCYIKENDVLYNTNEYDPERKVFVDVPGRIIMNTKTIAVYRDSKFSNALFTFNLADTQFSISKSRYCCFYLTNANRQFLLCGFNNNCGSMNKPIWVNNWAKDFDYFKKKCNKNLDESDVNVQPNPVLSNIGNPGTNKLRIPLTEKKIPGFDLGQSMVQARKTVIESQMQESITTENDKKVEATQKVALTALRREINLEDLIKNEEVRKGEEEIQVLATQVEQEKKKKNILVQALQMRESNFAQVRSSKETQKQIEQIKQEAKVDIKFKRAVLKKKIEEIRHKFKRKGRLLKQQIQLIRSEVAEEIMNANKKGNQKICSDLRQDIPKIAEYCDRNFSNDYNKNISCKDPSNFCYTCCENEFGNMYISNRDDCQSMCDDLDKSELMDGDWVWRSELDERKEAEKKK